MRRKKQGLIKKQIELNWRVLIEETGEDVTSNLWGKQTQKF